MPLAIPTFLIRHGRTEQQALKGKGVADMLQAAERLRESLPDLGRLIIMSSTLPRAESSALVLSDKFDDVRFIASKDLATYGNDPGRLTNGLDALLGKIADTHMVTLGNYDGLAVVTHAPLIHAAIHHSLGEVGDAIAYGGVYAYAPGSWGPKQ